VSGSGAPLLCVEDAWVRLSGREILRGVSLALGRGEVLALAGPNGAGKTTLFRAVSRVVPLTRGQILCGGRPIGELSRRSLAQAIGVVPQDVAVAFPFSVGEVVLMGRSPHLAPMGFESKRDLALAARAMERVGISALASRSMLELSGGERQLVLLARALAQEPQVLLLDEPTAHLDLRHRIQVLELVRELAADGCGALVVSHDLSLSARAADRLALLRDGRLLAVGPPRAVLTARALERAFDVEADVVEGPDGVPLVVPRTRSVPPRSEPAASGGRES
jgi:iron complex transport system ATP-binding protein